MFFKKRIGEQRFAEAVRAREIHGITRDVKLIRAFRRRPQWLSRHTLRLFHITGKTRDAQPDVGAYER